jgi:predicted nuclease of predicted toxin-antitoxin system
MKLLLDQGAPRSTAELLRQVGFDAVHVGEIDMARAEDNSILTRAAAENRAVVTLDADFHALLALSQANKPSVIRIRIEGLRAEELSQLLRQVISDCRAAIEKGAVLSVQNGRIRIRYLPIS